MELLRMCCVVQSQNQRSKQMILPIIAIIIIIMIMICFMLCGVSDCMNQRHSVCERLELKTLESYGRPGTRDSHKQTNKHTYTLTHS